MTKKIIMIDGNNLGYACMYQPALAKLNYDGLPTGAILGLIQSVLRIQRKYPDHIPIVLWDGVAQWRLDLLPEYKAQRSDTPEKVAIHESWARQRGFAMTLLLSMGFLQIRAADAEADDLVHSITTHLNTNDQAILCSADKDWWQAIRGNVTWLNPIQDQSVTLERLCTDPELVGGKNTEPFHDPREYLLAKAISGDTSDGIDGVAGVGLVTALQTLRKWSHPDDTDSTKLDQVELAVAEGREKSARGKAIAESREKIERNRKLMDWSLASADPKMVGISGQAVCDLEVKEICQAFGLKNVPARFQEWRDQCGKDYTACRADTIDWLEEIFPTQDMAWGKAA